MRYVSRLFIVLLLALTIAVGAATFGQRQGAGPSGGPPATMGEILIPANDGAVRRLNAKCAVIRRLIAGELTLADAAAWFQYLDAVLPAHDAAPLPPAAGPVADQYYRQVILWATGQARVLSPSQADRLERRLLAEWHGVLERGGATASEME